jgi:hypothetical protein
MPGGAGPAEQMATVGRIAHGLFTSAEIGRMLDDLTGYDRFRTSRMKPA